MHQALTRENDSGTIIYTLPSILQRIDLKQLFPIDQPLEVELGSGDGSFLVDYAGGHRHRNFVGVERLLGRVRKLDRKSRHGGLRNLAAIRIESSYFLKYLLPPHSAQAIHIYFPDPWPKRKHRRHRLVNELFPALAYEALDEGGRVYLRTDDHDYCDQMENVFAGNPRFHSVATPTELAEIATDFEKGFQARGVQTRQAAYERD